MNFTPWGAPDPSEIVIHVESGNQLAENLDIGYTLFVLGTGSFLRIKDDRARLLHFHWRSGNWYFLDTEEAVISAALTVYKPMFKAVDRLAALLEDEEDEGNYPLLINEEYAIHLLGWDGSERHQHAQRSIR